MEKTACFQVLLCICEFFVSVGPIGDIVHPADTSLQLALLTSIFFYRLEWKQVLRVIYHS